MPVSTIHHILGRLLATAGLVLAAMPLLAADPHSYAQPDKVRVRHIDLELEADFAARVLHGHADLHLEWLDRQARELLLDTRELTIARVETSRNGRRWKAAEFGLADAHPVLGSRLSIQVDGRQPRRVRIHYRTAPTASGLQWVEAVQTLGKTDPFMFSQSQAIHARSWVPLQDTPAVRFTYDAKLQVPAGLLALMSAENPQEPSADGRYGFRMRQPIPSYLMAIAIGRLAFQPISERAGVYAEPERLAAAVHEFADTGRMIQVAESLYGDYRWGRYDLLILPPSFPYGGMENPRLSFITPTVIAGDRSLVALIAHELAHSWSGNLVTNSSWSDFWLNEGFTSYVENRIIEALFGAGRANMEFVLDTRGLLEDFRSLPVPEELQRLRPDISRLDPDEIYTTTAYTKGSWFLKYLEHRVGRERLDTFLRAYFDHFAFRSIDTGTFVAYLREHLLADAGDAVPEAELQAWLREPGIPASAPQYEVQAFAAIDAERSALLAGERAAADLPGRDWNTHEWLYFLNGLPEEVDGDTLAALDAAFALTATGNSEIAFSWFQIGIRNGYAAIRPALERFLSEVGRRKFVVPLYRSLAARDGDREWARAVFERARPGYHPITTASVEDVFTRASGR